MSRTEHHRGSMEEVYAPEGVSMEDHIKALIAETGKTWNPDSYDTEVEFLADELYEKYYYHKKSDTLYRFLDRREFENEDEIIEAFENGDDTIGFEVRFYNGGAGFQECLDEAMDKLNEDRS